MKKILKSLLLLSAVTMATGTLVSCSDDDLPAADALFRPIISETDNIEHGLDANNAPYMIIKWDNYTNANEYTIRIEANDGSDTREVKTSELTVRFDNLQYDKEYNISISSANTLTGLTSKPFTLTTTSLDYPTRLATLGASDVIDTQARVHWTGDETMYDELKLYVNATDSLVADTTLNTSAIDAKVFIFKNLKPKTTYRVEAYQEGNYRGKKLFSTVAPENYEGHVIDLRGMEDGATYISTDQIAADVSDNQGEDIVYVLEGGTTYKISGGTAIPSTDKSITFVTGLTLAGNAVFRSGGGITLASGAEVEALNFEKIDFISDKAMPGGDNELPGNTSKNFGGRQVFNLNGVKGTVKNLTFKNCSVQGYRAMVRSQQDGDNINNIVLDGCYLNGLGDQGVFATNNKSGDWRSITMTNCTVTNIVMLCDLRMVTNHLQLNIENCTFCYAPIETTANANTPLLRLGSGNVSLNLKNTLFGPAMASSESAGGDVHMNVAGTAGSIFLNGTLGNSVVEQSYKTNFQWTELGADEPKIYPIEGLTDLGISETELWNKPAGGDFGIKGKVPGVDLSKLGDARWM